MGAWYLGCLDDMLCFHALLLQALPGCHSLPITLLCLLLLHTTAPIGLVAGATMGGGRGAWSWREVCALYVLVILLYFLLLPARALVEMVAGAKAVGVGRGGEGGRMGGGGGASNPCGSSASCFYGQVMHTLQRLKIQDLQDLELLLAKHHFIAYYY